MPSRPRRTDRKSCFDARQNGHGMIKKRLITQNKASETDCIFSHKLYKTRIRFFRIFLGLQKIKSVYLIFQYKTVPPDAVIIYSDSINFSLHSMHNTFIFFVARIELPQHGHKYFRVLEGFWF